MYGLSLPLPPNLLFGENLVDGVRIPPHFPHQKNSPHQLAIFIRSINTSFIYSCSHCCSIIYLTSGFMYRYIMLILINRWLLNLIYLQHDKSKERSKFLQTKFPTPSRPFNAIWKPCFSLFSSLLLSFFISNFINPCSL